MGSKLSPQALPEDQQQHENEEEKGILEDAPGVSEVAPLPADEVQEHADPQRPRNEQPEDAGEEHLDRQAHQACDARRRLLGLLEARHLPGGRLGDQGAQ